MRLNLAGGVIAALIIVAYGRSSSVGFDRYRVGPTPTPRGSDATAPAASSGQKSGMTNVRPQAARRERPAPERDDPLVGVRRA
jgi:hypothetical protein